MSTPSYDNAAVGIGTAATGRRAIARSLDTLLILAVLVAAAEAQSGGTGSSDDGTGIVIVSILVAFLFYLLHEILTVGLTGRSMGKLVVGVQVVRVEERRVPGVKRAAVRAVIPTLLLVFVFPLYPLPYLIAAFSPDRRWPHDRLAKTVVIR